ncbi:MAG: hypothetical protein II287_05670 [Bacteroidaceae bacterium]|jgi:hypothetical protein|nr:hypothetical protein [Bacteroidaceae bacterium]
MKHIFARVIVAIAIAFSCMLNSSAQVSVVARLDSVNFYVGEQDGLELQVTLPSNQRLQLPPFKKGMEIVPNVEIVEIDKPDTIELNDGNNLQITQRYVITAWDSAFYYLPPLQVKVDTSIYESKSLAFKVYTLDVDTLHADAFFPPRDVQELPFAWKDWEELFYAVLALFLLAAFITMMYHLIKKGKPIFKIIRRKKKLPAHQVAIIEIERIKQERTWAKEDSKEYYTLLTDALRTYIQERYSFSAMEMTSTEIIERLIQESDETSIAELREIFKTADLVKFAKWSTPINENDANLMAALQYVNETKIEEDPNAQPEPEVIKETDKNRQTQVRIMQFLVALAVVAIIVIVVAVVTRLYDMFV